MTAPSAATTFVARAVGRARREAARVLQDGAYRVDRAHQAAFLPALDETGRRIVDQLRAGDTAVVPIDELGLASTAAMEAAGGAVLDSMAEELRDVGPSGEPLIRMSSDVAALRAWATERALLAIAGAYIGVPASFQGVHARIERVNPAQVTSEHWHRDLEDRRMLKCFYFPEAVTLDHGPFEYVRDGELGRAGLRTVRHEVKVAERQGRMGLTDAEMARHVPPSRWRTAELAPRSLVFADPTASYHHGRLRTAARPALFFVYTSAFPRHPEHCQQYWNDRYPAAGTSATEGD